MSDVWTGNPQDEHSMTETVLWRRIHAPGHDACRVIRDQRGWCLEGTAVFLEEQAPACLSYRIVGTPDWLPVEGHVAGFVGDIAVDVAIARGATTKWMLNGRPMTGLDDCEHLDFGFTPATNLPHLRWLEKEGMASAPLPAAWLHAPYRTLQRLPQRYTRLTASTYWYEAPGEGFAAELLVSPSGFVRRYPGLWEADDGMHP
jgi:hypothetical protein